MEEKKRFNYNELCKSQEISVSIPEGTVVELAEVDELVDLILKTTRVFNKVDRLKQICFAELRFASDNGGNIHAITFTSDVATEANNIYKDIDRTGGIMDVARKLSSRQISNGFREVQFLISTPIDVVYAQTRNILTHIINRNTLYQKYGSDAGYTPNLNLDDAMSIIEKCVHMQNYLYDILYVLGNVTIATLGPNFGQDTPKELMSRIQKYSLYDTEHKSTLKTVMNSFRPESRFVIDETTNIIFNFK